VRYLILSDIHANWEALQAVVEHAHGEYDRVYCCGDLVGYGADPNRVVDWVREHVPVVVRGNHDKACAGLDDLEWFNPVARASAMWTRTVLTYDNLQFLLALPKGPIHDPEFDLLHGSPLDEDEYLISIDDARIVAPGVTRAISFFGHTHLQGGFQLMSRNLVRRLAKVPVKETEIALDLEPGGRYLINPGSVGQPRDGDCRAGYVLYDVERNTVLYRRVSYDIAGAQRRIVDAGLPPLLAARLSAGV
jgi:predicted phosphodiesterase